MTEMTEKCPDELSEAGYGAACTSCTGQRLCRESFIGVERDIEDIRVRMNVIKHKVFVMSGKGGVGKSTFAANLALSLAKKNLKVGLLDLDICGPSIANILKITDQTIVTTDWGWKPCESPHYKIKVISVASILASNKNAVIYKGPRKTNLIKKILKETFWGKLDYLIVDTPPGTSDEHLTILRLLKDIRPDGALLITTPHKLSVNTIRKEVTFCHKMKLPILGLVENMSYLVCNCCNEKTPLFPSSDNGEELLKLAQANEFELFGSLPFDQSLCEATDAGENFLVSNHNATALENILDQVYNKVENFN